MLPKESGRFRAFHVALSIVLGALLLGPASVRAEDDAAIAHAKALSRAFRKAAETAVPTVVKITTRTRPVARPRGRRGNPFRGTPFEDYFSEEEMERLFEQSPGPRDGVGSGVIIDAQGIVLTNNHVVEGADEVVVRLNDGREFKTNDIKFDPETDLAVLRLEGAKDLPAARMGDSDKLETGDWVIAVGNPFQLETTVSAGIISAKGRSLGSVRRSKFLQTDAAINPGNSGGPLVNLDGEVVGINTAIASNNGGYQGIGFAIPINTARWVTTQLVKTGKVQRAYLGVSIEEVTAELGQKFNLRPGQGVLIQRVLPETPAAEAGLEEGDLVTKFAGAPVNGPRELQELVERAPLDSKQPLVVLRDGKTMTRNVIVKALPEDFGVAGRQSAQPPRDEKPEEGERPTYSNKELGLEVTELTAAAKELQYDDQTGVLVRSVERGGLAHASGLREGMLIQKVGKRSITDVPEFQAALKAESLEDGILLLVRSERGTRFLVLGKSTP